MMFIYLYAIIFAKERWESYVLIRYYEYIISIHLFTDRFLIIKIIKNNIVS